MTQTDAYERAMRDQFGYRSSPLTTRRHRVARRLQCGNARTSRTFIGADPVPARRRP